MKNPKVLVSGAGIAGVSLAHLLHGYGFAPTVVERAPEIRAGGYKVDIRGAALEVARRMGILDELRAMRTEVRAGTIVDAAGKQVASMDGDTFGGRVSDDAEVLRGDLHQLLFDRTKDNVEYLFDDSIAELADDGDGVDITFAGGRTDRFDLVVGADGARSATRRLVFGPDGGHRHEMGYYVSVYSVPNDLNLDREEVTYVGPGRTALAYSTAREGGAKAMFLFAADPAAEAPRGQEAQKQFVRAAYAGEGWQVPRLLEGLDTTPDFYFDSLCQIRMDSWSSGRTVLLGDAAHCASPASGQGTSLALVGAYVLAGELAAAGGEHGTAFAAYQRELRSFVETNQKLGPANIKRMVLRDKRQVKMSMMMLGLMGKMPGKEKMMAKVVAPIGKAANAITLKDY